MVRWIIIGIVIAVAFTLFALVDAAMSEPFRSRGVPKPIWIVVIVLLPVVGAALWFWIGKDRAAVGAPRPPRAPDDDPRFTGTSLSQREVDEHVRELEDRLRELDAETFPGEQPPSEQSDGSDGREGADGEPNQK